MGRRKASSLTKAYEPEPLRKMKLWVGTIRATAKINGVAAPFGVQIRVLADTFERASQLVLDAGFIQAQENPQAVRDLEVVQLEFAGFTYFTDLDVMEAKGHA